jgi:hypothetical protein
MVAQKINIPGIQDPGNVEAEIVLKPVTLYHQDGATEIAYVQTSGTTDKSKSGSLHSHLAVAYMSIGIIALTISAFVGIHKMKNS